MDDLVGRQCRIIFKNILGELHTWVLHLNLSHPSLLSISSRAPFPERKVGFCVCCTYAHTKHILKIKNIHNYYGLHLYKQSCSHNLHLTPFTTILYILFPASTLTCWVSLPLKVPLLLESLDHLAVMSEFMCLVFH